MNGVHDMGGMHGFGRVEIEENEPVFHEEWEGRVYGLLNQCRAAFGWRVGGNRALIESMEPAKYLTASYYERFLHALEEQALASGAITKEELQERFEHYREHPDAPVPRREDSRAVARTRERLRTAREPELEGPAPRFSAGDRVLARNLNPRGHTRLPRYVRGKRGVITRVNGWSEIEDADPSELGSTPQTVYTVAFTAPEIWGPNAEPNQMIYLEMWEGYLDPAL
jgi:nitrile hydratase subunit beta